MICDEMSSHKYVLTAPRKSQTVFRKNLHTKTTFYFWYESFVGMKELLFVCGKRSFRPQHSQKKSLRRILFWPTMVLKSSTCMSSIQYLEP